MIVLDIVLANFYVTTCYKIEDNQKEFSTMKCFRYIAQASVWIPDKVTTKKQYKTAQSSLTCDRILSHTSVERDMHDGNTCSLHTCARRLNGRTGKTSVAWGVGLKGVGIRFGERQKVTSMVYFHQRKRGNIWMQAGERKKVDVDEI